MKKLYKNFIFDIILAVVMLALGIVMLPPFGIGQQALNILCAILLVAYMIIYMLDKIQRSKGTTLVLALVEFAIIAIIAITLVVQQFSEFKIGGICKIVGAVMWMRGVFSAFGMYITATSARRPRYGVIKFLLCVLLSSTGVYIFADPIVSDLALTWIACVLFFIAALVAGGLALLFAPTKEK